MVNTKCEFYAGSPSGFAILQIVPPILNHLRKKLHHLRPGLITLLMRLGRYIRQKHRQRRQPLIHIMIQLTHLPKQLSLHIITMKSPQGSQNSQCRYCVEEINLTLGSPISKEFACFRFDFLDIALEAGGAESVGHGGELHLAFFGVGVVDDSWAKDKEINGRWIR